ncbi:MAG: hypothetical protein H0T65_18620 [Deltaproteobacteria bacterium]|nr:hypothetical protein [Deltaproteobacteria bacterium]
MVCPEDPNESQPMATDASPDTFYVRIMFDELLDPSVEDLIPILDDNDLETGTFTGTIANTKPVTLKCTGIDGVLRDVNYDGYYSPSGNSVTWPVGPSLVIKQLGDVIIPTNSMCEVTIKDFVKDKQGVAVPADQRGPFKFRVSGIKPLVVDPSDDSEVTVDALWFGNFYHQFNTTVAAPPADTDFLITPEPGFCAVSGRACVVTATHCNTADPADLCEPAGLYSYAISNAEFGYGPIGYPETESTYTFEVKAGTMLEDQCGAITTTPVPTVENLYKVTVKTQKFDLLAAGAFTINNGDVVPATRKIKIGFNAPIALVGGIPDIVAANTFTIDPAPFAAPVPPATTATVQLTPQEMVRTTAPGIRENDLFIRGHYKPSTDYTFTLKNGAVIKDNYGKTYTQMGDRVIKFKTQPVAIAASSPANGATVTKATPASATTIAFSFNTAMDPTTWTAADVDLIGTATTLTFGAAPNTCTSTTATSCTLLVQGVFTPGTYTVRLKAGAVVKDVFGTDYTQAADRSIQFTVKDPGPPAPVIPCLGA